MGYILAVQTVVETPYYLTRANKLLSEAEQQVLVSTVAAAPDAGVFLGGGLRKLRFARGGKGKRGGVRVVYFYHDEDMPVFMLEIFDKNEKDNLSAVELKSLVKLAGALKESYGAKHGKKSI